MKKLQDPRVEQLYKLYTELNRIVCRKIDKSTIKKHHPKHLGELYDKLENDALDKLLKKCPLVLTQAEEDNIRAFAQDGVRGKIIDINPRFSSAFDLSIGREFEQEYERAVKEMNEWDERCSKKRSATFMKEAMGLIKERKRSLQERFNESFYKLACPKLKRESVDDLEMALNKYFEETFQVDAKTLHDFEEIKEVYRQTGHAGSALEEQMGVMNEWEPFLIKCFEWIQYKKAVFEMDAAQASTVYALYARMVKSFELQYQSSSLHLIKYFNSRFKEFRKYVKFTFFSNLVTLGRRSTRGAFAPRKSSRTRLAAPKASGIKSQRTEQLHLRY